MDVVLPLVVLVAAVLVVAALAHRIHVSPPLLLTAVGVIASFVPALPTVELTADLVLFGLLPPLLYAAALRTPLADFRTHIRPIALLSVGLVIFTAFGVALVAQMVLPISFPAALALGAVVAPPDAVSATSIARRVGMPRRLVSILEGESLVNDATALVMLRTALAATAGVLSLVDVVGNLLIAAGGGIAIGIAAAALVTLLRRRLRDPLIDTTVSLITPLAVFMAGEVSHVSGVLAVVVAGLLIGHKSYSVQTPLSRISERTNWATIQFVLENVVFLLIGLQVAPIVTDAAGTDLSLSQVLIACASVLLAVIALRPLWIYPTAFLSFRIGRGDVSSRPTLAGTTAVSWAGMRGVVTLATAFVLPDDLPLRNVLVLVAMVVTAGTLLIQGATLPRMIRWLGLRGPNRREDLLQQAQAIQEANSAGLATLAEIATDRESWVAEEIRGQLRKRSDIAWERLGRTEREVETPSAAFGRLRTEMAAAERKRLIEMRNSGMIPYEVLRPVLFRLDVEEAVLQSWLGDEVEEEMDENGPTMPALSRLCPHLDESPLTAVPNTPEGCEECLQTGDWWVHLRLCLSCGHVGCCDSSPNRHASAHSAADSHPVVRSFEPGETWRWCYVDEKIG